MIIFKSDALTELKLFKNIFMCNRVVDI